MAALPVTALPEGDAWLYEAKFDGYRALVLKNGPRVNIISRNGNDLTRSYPAVRQAAEKLTAKAAVIDGEVVAFDESGRPFVPAVAAPDGEEHGDSVLCVRSTAPGRHRPAIRAAYSQTRRLAETRRRIRTRILDELSRHSGSDRPGHRQRGPGGCRGQAPRLAIRAREAQRRVAEVQSPAPPGISSSAATNPNTAPSSRSSSDTTRNANSGSRGACEQA
jgi:hypothetical protein